MSDQNHGGGDSGPRDRTTDTATGVPTTRPTFVPRSQLHKVDHPELGNRKTVGGTTAITPTASVASSA